MTGIKGNGAPYELIDPSRQIKVTPLDTTVIVAQVVVRVLVVVTIWLVLCFAIFLGFFYDSTAYADSIFDGVHAV